MILLVVVALFPLGLRRLWNIQLLMCLLWAEMGAVDVAFTEATGGAGASTGDFNSHCF